METNTFRHTIIKPTTSIEGKKVFSHRESQVFSQKKWPQEARPEASLKSGERMWLIVTTPQTTFTTKASLLAVTARTHC
jgi:hypothetical protein